MPRYKTLDDMPTGLRKLFDAQFEKTEDGKIVERKVTPAPKICVQDQIKEHDKKMAIPPPPPVPDLPEFIPHRAMNVGADQVALSNLNKTEIRYLEILRSRPENLWIGVHVFRLRIAANPSEQTAAWADAVELEETEPGHFEEVGE